MTFVPPSEEQVAEVLRRGSEVFDVWVAYVQEHQTEDADGVLFFMMLRSMPTFACQVFQAGYAAGMTDEGLDS